MILENTLALLFVVNLARTTAAAAGSILSSFARANNLNQLDETTDLDDTRLSIQADQELILPQWTDNWIAPEEIRKSFPFYLAGYDEEGSPVYVAEYGQWNFTQALDSYSGDGGREDLKNLVMKYLQQGIYRAWRHGMAGNNQGIVVVCDWSGFTVANYLDDTAVEFCLAQMQMLDGIHHVLKHALIINTNSASENLLGVAKPLMGNLLAKCKMSGSSTEKWLVDNLRTVSGVAGKRIGRWSAWQARTRNDYYPWIRFA